jgi:hypothetical protein
MGGVVMLWDMQTRRILRWINLTEFEHSDYAVTDDSIIACPLA